MILFLNLPNLNSDICSHIEVDEGAAVQRIFSNIFIVKTEEIFYHCFVAPNIDKATFPFTHFDLEPVYSGAFKQIMRKRTNIAVTNNTGYFFII